MKIAFVYMNDTPGVGFGAGYVASAIIDAGYNITFFDTYWDPLKKIAKVVIKGNYDILMISSMTMAFPNAVELIKQIKDKMPNITVLVGGIHTVIVGGKILDECPLIDYLCIGEGESFVIEFLKYFNKEPFFGIKNLVYRKDGRVVVNELRPPEDLSKLPRFCWKLFRNESVAERGSSLMVSATRGCPYSCTYCCNSVYLKMYGKKYLRFRPIESIISELRYLVKTYKPGFFYFGDEMIFFNKERAIELFSKVKENFNIHYGCMARVEHINKEIVDLISDTGCKYIAMGIECGNEEFRKKYLNRHMSNEQIINAYTLIKNAGIQCISFNMIGYPFDNDDFLAQETLNINLKIKPDFAQISVFYPLPGTELYKRCIEFDLIDDEKAANTRTFHKDSILKGKSLLSKRNDMNAILNGNETSAIKCLETDIKGTRKFERKISNLVMKSKKMRMKIERKLYDVGLL
ncbi:MAG: radical SAM protein [Candidatus Aenigmarchaeota archaeon]|nr:radical SAM protein [Candidatus Aenigmarchaeota archaeon]